MLIYFEFIAEKKILDPDGLGTLKPDNFCQATIWFFVYNRDYTQTNRKKNNLLVNCQRQIVAIRLLHLNR